MSVTHLHHYVDGVCSGAAARPGPCGEPQVFRPPTGGVTFADVLVDRTDLAALVELARVYQDLAAPLPVEVTELLARMEELL